MKIDTTDLQKQMYFDINWIPPRVIGIDFTNRNFLPETFLRDGKEYHIVDRHSTNVHYEELK